MSVVHAPPPDAPRVLGARTDARPAGYVEREVGTTTLVCRADIADALHAELSSHGTLYAWAGAHPGRQELRGRAVAWAVPLADGSRGVVRHSWHGGLLAPLTRDLFVTPTRAPHELALSGHLRAAGVRTPEVVAYALYPAPFGLQRADVVTRLVPSGRDLAALLRTLPIQRDPIGPWVRAVGGLLHDLARAGVQHPDLNLKNVLLTTGVRAADDEAYDAWVLDLDVARLAAQPVSEHRRHAIGEANLARLERSLVKWREKRGLAVSELELACLRVVARHGRDAKVDLVWRPGHNVGTT